MLCKYNTFYIIEDENKSHTSKYKLFTGYYFRVQKQRKRQERKK